MDNFVTGIPVSDDDDDDPMENMTDEVIMEDINRLFSGIRLSNTVTQTSLTQVHGDRSDHKSDSSENESGRVGSAFTNSDYQDSDRSDRSSFGALAEDSADLAMHSFYDLHAPDDSGIFDSSNFAEQQRYGRIIEKDKELCWGVFLMHLDCLLTKQPWPLTAPITEETLHSILVKYFLEPEEDVALDKGTRVIAVPNPRRLSYKSQGLMYQRDAKDLAYRGVVWNKVFDEHMQLEKIHIDFDLTADDKVSVHSPFLKVLNSVRSMQTLPSSMEPEGKLFGVRVPRPGNTDALVIGKCTRASQIDGIDTVVLAVPFNGVGEKLEKQDCVDDKGRVRFQYTRKDFDPLTAHRNSDIWKHLSAGYLDGDFAFVSLDEFARICVPTHHVDDQHIFQLGFTARYMNDSVNDAIWPLYRNVWTENLPFALDLLLVEIAQADLAIDVAGWPNGLHIPRGDDPDVEWSMLRGVLKKEFADDAEALSTKKEYMTCKADIDNAIVSWSMICDAGKPQTSFGPTLRKLEADKLFMMLADHCADNTEWHSTSGTSIFDERLGCGRSIAEDGPVLANSSEYDYNQMENLAWSPLWCYPHDALPSLLKKCEQEDMNLEVHHHEHAHNQWTSTLVVGRNNLEKECLTESDADDSEHEFADGQRNSVKKVAWRGVVCTDPAASSNASAYLVLGTLFPEATPQTWTEDKYFLRLQKDFSRIMTKGEKRFAGMCTACVEFYKTGDARNSKDKYFNLHTKLWQRKSSLEQHVAEKDLKKCCLCHVYDSGEVIGEMCIACGHLYSGSAHWQAFPNLSNDDDPDALLKCWHCQKLLRLEDSYTGVHIPRRKWNHETNHFETVARRDQAKTSAPMCARCLWLYHGCREAKRLLHKKGFDHRRVTRTCRQCMPYLCSECDEMRPARMYEVHELRNHRRSDRSKILVCSVCKEKPMSPMQDQKIKCSACDLEKDVASFESEQVQRVRRKIQTVEGQIAPSLSLSLSLSLYHICLYCGWRILPVCR